MLNAFLCFLEYICISCFKVLVHHFIIYTISESVFIDCYFSLFVSLVISLWMPDILILHCYVLNFFFSIFINVMGICSGIQLFENRCIHGPGCFERFKKIFFHSDYTDYSQTCVIIKGCSACAFLVILCFVTQMHL